MGARIGRKWSFVGLVSVAVAIPAGYAIAQEVTQDEQPASSAGPVPAKECSAPVNEAFSAEGFSPESFAPDCPTAEEARKEAAYHSDLRRLGLTKIAESMRQHNPDDPELAEIEEELSELGGPSTEYPAGMAPPARESGETSAPKEAGR